MVLLSELVRRYGGAADPSADPVLTDVHIDSRRVGAGELFCALPGQSVDGASFASAAVRRGAAAVLSAVPLGLDATNWVHPQARRVTGLAAGAVHGDPSQALDVVGITGTNGKSTVAHLTGALLEGLGRTPAVIGTIEYRLAGGEVHEATHTTPDATELQRLCRRHLELGGDAFVLEASSHALDQERLSGLALDVAVFTNLGHDHLDYHPDIEAYAAAKARLFAHLAPKKGSPPAAVVHADDAHAGRMIEAARAAGAEVVTYGIGSRADLRASRLVVGDRGTHLFLEGMGIPQTGYFLPLVGRHNVENALAALAVVLQLGASATHALDALASISPPPGRLEPVPTGSAGFRVFVDYAHTPDALERVLGTLRELLAAPGEEPRATARAGRLLCVFGSGGDRDVEKRQPMGEAAGRLADIVFVTSDNPRTEEPQAIVDEVLRGAQRGSAEVIAEVDRRTAIRRALREARSGDVVLIAGKGHESWQWQHGRKLPFDDRLVVREELP